MQTEITMADVPLIYTTKGNLPVDSLAYSTHWEDAEDYMKFVETYKLEGEVVKESVHVYCKKPLELAAIQGLFG